MKKIFNLLQILFTVLILVTVVSAQNSPQATYDELSLKAEQNQSYLIEAKRAALDAGLPLSIYLEGYFTAYVIAVENNMPVYTFITNLQKPAENASVKFFEEITTAYDISAARINYGNRKIINPEVGFTIRPSTEIDPSELILVPESSNDRVMAFDKMTGDLVDIDYIPTDETNLSTPIEATINSAGNVLVSDQIDDAVMEYDTSGAFIRVFAPAGGANNDILNNVRGHAYHPASGNLLVTSASSPSDNVIAEFDADGNFLRNLVAQGSGGLNGPFDIFFRGNEMLITASSSNAVHRYDLDGNYVDDFIPSVTFPEQMSSMSNGNIIVAGFSPPSGVHFYDPDGNFITTFTAITGLRGVYELGNGNILVTNGAGVHELDGSTGALIRTMADGVSARFITEAQLVAPDFIPIAAATIDDNGDFVPDMIDSTVTVQGIVNSVNYTASSNRFSYYIEDNTGGINITKGSETGGGPVYDMGDKIKVTGVVGQYNGSTQLNLDADQLAGIELVSTGNMLMPMEMSIADFLTNAEMYEGRLIKFMNVSKTAGSVAWPAAGSDANMTITDGTGELTLRIDKDTDIDGNPEPEWPVNIVGVATQYTTSVPPDNGYQITPNYYADFTPYGMAVSFMVNPEWNMVSAPVMMDDMSVATMFPNATSSAFAFDNGYVTATDLMNGAGYWLKFDSGEEINLFGMPAEGNISLVEGWNMIGPFHMTMMTDEVMTDPAGIISSEFFGFDETYTIADSLVPGHGYWIKASAAGEIVMGPAPKRSPVSHESIAADWAKVILTDAAGRNTTLYISEKSVTGYELPPLPPATAFDARFTSGSYVENLNDAVISLHGAIYPVTLRIDGADVKVSDNLGGTVLNETLKSGGEIVLNEDMNGLRISSVEIPVSFELAQNYPNPFNPVTTIKFAVPEASRVILKVYNAIGEEVNTLLDRDMDAGYFDVSFDASSLSSGIYFYTISAGEFSAVKKMVLLK